jgi:hypothetical protein
MADIKEDASQHQLLLNLEHPQDTRASITSHITHHIISTGTTINSILIDLTIS